MAQFIPPTYGGNTPPGERRVFRDLQDCPGTENWKVLHSFDLPEHIRQIEGEIDFLILIPGHGVVCLEVKSHDRIARDEFGVWEMGTKKEARGPFKQASEAMHSLRTTRLKNLNSGVPMISAVAFTEVVFNEPAVEWEPWQVLDSRDFEGVKLRDALLRVCAAMRQKFSTVETARWFVPGTPEPTEETVRSILHVLRPHFEVFQTPSERLKNLDQEILEFTQQQFDALDQMEFNRSVLFDGPAGTGKTVLAIEAARRASNQGKKVLYLCFNKRLSDTVSSSIGQLGNVHVSTFHALLLKITGLNPDGKNLKNFFEVVLPGEALKVVSGAEFEKYDVVVVDEFQDLAQDNFVPVIRQLCEPTDDGAREFFFGDFAEQTIFGNAANARQTRDKLGIPIFRLTKNCRNRPELDGVLANQGFNFYSEYLRSAGGETSFLSELKADYVPRMATAIKDLIGRYTVNQVKILVPTTASNPPGILKAVLAALGNNPMFRPEVVSIYEFKGLECKAVVLFGLGDVTFGANRRLFYIAATRPTERLVISMSEEYIRSAT
jgi:hypothetical protein